MSNEEYGDCESILVSRNFSSHTRIWERWWLGTNSDFQNFLNLPEKHNGLSEPQKLLITEVPIDENECIFLSKATWILSLLLLLLMDSGIFLRVLIKIPTKIMFYVVTNPSRVLWSGSFWRQDLIVFSSYFLLKKLLPMMLSISRYLGCILA